MWGKTAGKALAQRQGLLPTLLGLTLHLLLSSTSRHALSSWRSVNTQGKTAGKDLLSDKATYPALLGLERSQVARSRCTHVA